jgi:hypothetical protein
MRIRHFDLWLQKLRAVLGDRDACHDLGARYATGDHGEWPELEDARAAIRWYRRGAALGDAACRYDLGFMYLLGEGAVQDRDAAIELLSQSASQGFCDAIRLLADVFARGVHGVASDPLESERWSRVLSEHLIAHPEDRRLHER